MTKQITNIDLQALARSVGEDLGLVLELVPTPYDYELYVDFKGKLKRIVSFANKAEARRGLHMLSTITVLKKQLDNERMITA
jgi:hypothetical protein